MIRVMITEDQAIVREGLKMMIEQEEHFQVVAEASTGNEAINKMHDHSIDIVIMDIRMPELNGVEAT